MMYQCVYFNFPEYINNKQHDIHVVRIHQNKCLYITRGLPNGMYYLHHLNWGGWINYCKIKGTRRHLNILREWYKIQNVLRWCLL